MLRLDFLGILVSVFLLGPKNWRWSLWAAAVAKITTVLILVLWRVDLAAYTMGGLFTEVDMVGGRLPTFVLGLMGPFVCYGVARMTVRHPMGKAGWLKQILPWSELDHPMAATFAKYAMLAAIFNIITAFS